MAWHTMKNIYGISIRFTPHLQGGKSLLRGFPQGNFVSQNHPRLLAIGALRRDLLERETESFVF